MDIRKPQRDEYPQIVEVINSETELYKTVFSEEEMKNIGIGDESVEGLEAGEQTREYLVAVESKMVMGFASWYIKDNNVAWISMLQVLPEHRRKGVATALVREVETQAIKKGAKALAAETQKKAYWVKDLNIKYGFKILSWDELKKEPYAGTLDKPPVPNTYVFGKSLIT